MIEVAKDKLKDDRVEFIVADAETIEQDRMFDLIASNACFQWFQDLDKALKRYMDMLTGKGLLLFSIFGPRTYCELNASLRDVFGETEISAEHFTDENRLKAMLGTHFDSFCVTEVVYEEEFKDLTGLLKKIKYTGTNGVGLTGEAFLGPEKLKALEASYLCRFKKIKATYQVFFCEGIKA
jgi:malonyl-CoA O-methyltransferase